MDTLVLKECRFSAHIGITGAERAKRQEVIIDVEMLADTRKAAQSDSIKDTVDYIRVYDEVKKIIEGSSFELVEALGEKIAGTILKKFPVASVTLTLKKTKPMKVRKGAWAGVRMTRKR